MDINWRGAARGLGEGLAEYGRVRVSDEVSQLREQRMAQYQQAAVADERAYQDGVRQEGYIVQGLLGQQEREAEAAAKAAEYAREDRQRIEDHERDMEIIERRGQVDPRATVVNVDNTPGALDFEAKRAEELAKGLGARDLAQVERVDTELNGAAALEDQLRVLESVSDSFNIGKVNEAMARLGEFLGTEQGAALQAFRTVQNNLVLNQMDKMTGVVSDSDLKLLEATVPRFGNDPRANRIVIDLMRRSIDRARENRASLDAYLEQNATLRGWQPPYEERAATRGATSTGESQAAGDVLTDFNAWKAGP